MKFYVFLGNGFETVEALGAIDILRRGKIDVCTVSVHEDRTVISSHNIPVVADTVFCDNDYSDGVGLLLPGGLKGVENLEAHEGLMNLVDTYVKEGKLITSICAGPSILGHKGLLNGKKATCYPGFEPELTGAICNQANVEVDGKYITGKGMGVTIEFALAILKELTDDATVEHVATSTMYRN